MRDFLMRKIQRDVAVLQARIIRHAVDLGLVKPDEAEDHLDRQASQVTQSEDWRR